MVGDEAELFERYHQRLVRATACRVQTSRDNVDEACAFAWATLLRRGPDVERKTVFAWLKVVACHEAVRLARLDREHRPIGWGPGEMKPELIDLPSGNAYVTPEALDEAMDRLHALPERLQRVVVMRAFGWKYTDIADELGISRSRVNGLLARADDYLHKLRERELADRHPRAARLRDLEEHPPGYLRAVIGKPPRFRRWGRIPELQRDWRRLALAIEDHRERYGITDSNRALGSICRSHGERAARDALRDRIDQYLRERGEVDGLYR